MHDPTLRSRAAAAAAQLMVAALLVLVAPLGARDVALASAEPLDPQTIGRFVEPLPMPLRVPVAGTTPAAPLELTLNEFQQPLLPNSFYAALPAPWNAGAYLWCYKAAGWPQTFPGPTLEARVGVPASIRYVNNLVGPGGGPPVLQEFIKVDQTLHWADPLGVHGSMEEYRGPVPAVTHLHGGEVPSAFDGGPDAWWTPGLAHRGHGFVTDTYTYPNAQEATTLWYHDHALGATRLNVYAGLAGFYLLRDPGREPANLPGGAVDPVADRYGNSYEREVVIQDRMFDTNGQLYWPDDGINPEVHPFWVPEFFGDVIVVNGKSWPYLEVEPRRYRFRLLNGSNARFYDLRFSREPSGTAGPGFWQIGSDGGLLDHPVLLRDPAAKVPALLVMAPGERCDVIVDFSAFAGQTLTLRNNAKAPFPNGDSPSPQATGMIMQVRVGAAVTGGVDASLSPTARTALRVQPIERPALVPVTRALTLNENMGPGGPLEVLVNNTMWDMAATETQTVGATEVWEIINLTADTHPIHLHLVQFQLLNRQAFNTKRYARAYGMPMPGMGAPLPYSPATPATGGKLGGNPDITPYLLGRPAPPDGNETGWKDTFRMNPGEVTRVLVRVAPQDADARVGGPVAAGMNLYPFDPTAGLGTSDDGFGYPGGPGYVWHCHIVDHEDNEMMRPYRITRSALPVAASQAEASAEVAEARPSLPTLAMAEPNPTSAGARIAFSLPVAEDVELAVFDVTGREVARLAEGRHAAGEHVVMWTGTDRAGRPLPSGAYLYRLRAGAVRLVRKVVLMR